MRLAAVSLITLLLICLSACLASSTASAACPPEDEIRATLATAEELYVLGDYGDIPGLIEPLVVTEQCIDNEERKLDAFLILGTSEFQLGELEVAKLTFLDMLRLNPDFSVDDSVISVPPPVRQYIQIVRDENKDELDAIRKEKLIEEGAVVETLWVTVRETRNQYWLNFVPFGAGQFQNGDVGWGSVFASTELAALGLAFTGAIMVEVIRARDGRNTFSPDALDEAEAWQLVQISGMIGFAVLYVGGVIHALVNYEDVKRSVLPPSRDRPGELEEEAAVRWMIGPDVRRDGAGVSFVLEF